MWPKFLERSFKFAAEIGSLGRGLSNLLRIATVLDDLIVLCAARGKCCVHLGKIGGVVWDAPNTMNQTLAAHAKRCHSIDEDSDA